MKLILIGPPGSGKGTVSERLTKDFKLMHISPGELLREEITKGTSLGTEVKQYMDRGELVPCCIVSEIVHLITLNHDNFLLDGYPRTLEQANLLEKTTEIDLVLSLDLSEETAVERISGRLTCEKCGFSYHLEYIPPKNAGICDQCSGKLIQRADQKPEIVKERFRVYKEQSLPLINHYQKKGLLRSIDASGTPPEVYALAKQAVEKD
ncbi:MAG: nucleoside monophosphate kinase [Candidatus Woesearchaeota archaeon]